jgi:hypothetical protein
MYMTGMPPSCPIFLRPAGLHPPLWTPLRIDWLWRSRISIRAGALLDHRR